MATVSPERRGREHSKSLPGPLIIENGKVKIADARRDSTLSRQVRNQIFSEPQAVKVQVRRMKPKSVLTRAKRSRSTKRAPMLKVAPNSEPHRPRSQSTQPRPKKGSSNKRQYSKSNLIKAAIELARGTRNTKTYSTHSLPQPFSTNNQSKDKMPDTLKQLKASGSLKSVRKISRSFDEQKVFSTPSPTPDSQTNSTKTQTPTNIRELCEHLNLQPYLHQFLTDQILISDLPFLEHDELRELVPDRDALERLTTYIAGMCNLKP